MEKEQIPGFDIDVRELTDEEADQEITLDRFDEFHSFVGEDFCDTCGHVFNHLILGGFLLAKHPNLNKEIMEVCNSRYGELLSYLHLYEEQVDDYNEAQDSFYSDLAEFFNLTGAAKRRANMILIRVKEVYDV